MTASGVNGLPGAAEVRVLIREVLTDALTAGSLDSLSPGRKPGGGLPAAGDGAARTRPTLPAAPPSDIPAGTVQQIGPVQAGLRAPTAPGRTAAPACAAGGRTATGAVDGTGPARHVRLATDEDLREFVLTVLRLADNPARRRDLLAGRLRFTLNGPPGGQRGSVGGQADPAMCRIETGAVTERAVQAAAKAGGRLVLGRRAVLTPLARDRALALGVPIEKER